MLDCSTDGFAHWAKPRGAALKSGRYIRTRAEPYELPAMSLSTRKVSGDEAKSGVRQTSGVWFPDAVIEMCIRTDRYDFELTLLHFEGKTSAWQAEDDEPGDSYTQFLGRGKHLA